MMIIGSYNDDNKASPIHHAVDAVCKYAKPIFGNNTHGHEHVNNKLTIGEAAS